MVCITTKDILARCGRPRWSHSDEEDAGNDIPEKLSADDSDGSGAAEPKVDKYQDTLDAFCRLASETVKNGGAVQLGALG